MSDTDLHAPMTSMRFLTLDQVAVELNVSRAQVYALVWARQLLAVKIGGRGHWRVERSELEAYIARLYRETRAKDTLRLAPYRPVSGRGR